LILGGISTAILLSILAGLASPFPALLSASLLSACFVLALLSEFGIAVLPLPENRRLIPQEVFSKHPLLGSMQFGFELGTGVRTYVPAASPYLVAVAVVLLAPEVWVAALAGVGFGLGRAVMPISRSCSRQGENWDKQLMASIGAIQKGALLTLLVGLSVLAYDSLWL
jgi:hypothetical protein